MDTLPSNLHISTMVQIGRMKTNIILSELSENLSINDTIKYIEYRSQISKGEKATQNNGKRKSTAENKQKKNFFYNQVTVHVMDTKRVNTKIFNNGRIQMTGIKTEEQGERVMNILLKEFINISSDKKEKIFDNHDIKLDEYIETVLINTDFDINYQVDRETLHRFIVDRGYYSSYEPCTYPGVNIKYYHNSNNDNFGICNCEKPCNGKGKGTSCKRITIAVFNSGKIIITGGRNKNNIITAYNFITNILNSNKELFEIKELIE